MFKFSVILKTSAIIYHQFVTNNYFYICNKKQRKVNKILKVTLSPSYVFYKTIKTKPIRVQQPTVRSFFSVNAQNRQYIEA